MKRPRDSLPRQREKRRPSVTPPKGRTIHDGRFGDIPIIEVTRRDATGQTDSYAAYDPDYLPPMPTGAVRGDVRNQHFCPMCHVPRYFYVDQPRRCVECGVEFIFSGKEQKHWYEKLKFHFDSVAIRCIACRKRRRTKLALHTDLARTRAKVEKVPGDAKVLLELAECIVRLHEHTGEGNLRDAIAAARNARRRAGSHKGMTAETFLWEGRAQALLGRAKQARPLLESFVERHPGGKRGVMLVREAKWCLEKLEPG
jgi:Probable zinc-ribbon domain